MSQLIVFEGCDKSGKSTQANKLLNYLNLNGYKSELYYFPYRSTEIGKLLNKYLKKEIELEDHVVSLLFSANRWELMPLISNKLKLGINIILDRYYYSGIAYSSVKLDTKWCESLDRGLPIPTIIYYLSNVFNKSYDLERYETSDFQMKVDLNFQRIFNNSSEQVIKINACDSIDNIHQIIINHVLSII